MDLCNVILGEGIIDSWFHNVGDSKNLKAFKKKLKDLWKLKKIQSSILRKQDEYDLRSLKAVTFLTIYGQKSGSEIKYNKYGNKWVLH